VSLSSWSLTLEVIAIVRHTRLGTLSEYQVQISQYGPHGSDIPCDLVTLTFNLRDHGACRWCGSTSSIRTSTLKFLRFTVRKIWHISCVCVSWPVTLTFDLLTLKLVCESHLKWGTFFPNLGTLGLWVLELFGMYATDRQSNERTKATLIASFPTGGGIKRVFTPN